LSVLLPEDVPTDALPSNDQPVALVPMPITLAPLAETNSKLLMVWIRRHAAVGAGESEVGRGSAKPVARLTPV